MRKAVLLAALAAFSAVVSAAPDVIVKPNAVYARRGALGANDYVATNVAPCVSAYAIRDVRDGRLHDRTVNMVAIEGREAELALPSRRTVAGFARALVVSLTSATNAVVRLAGAAALYGSDGDDRIRVEPGLNVISVVEIGNEVYLAEVRPLVRIAEEN